MSTDWNRLGATAYGDLMTIHFFPIFLEVANSEVFTLLFLPRPTNVFLIHNYLSFQQMIDLTDIPVSSILSPPLPPTNFYFLAIMRIHDVKYGPFHEHSSQLHSIAAGVPNWGKVNSGLFKMFEVRSCSVRALRSGSDVLTLRMFLFPNQAEVLGKRVVVQHIPLGGLLEWENSDNPAPSTASSVSQGSTPQSANQIYPSTAPPRAPSRPAPARAMLPPMIPPTGLNSGATQAPWLNPHAGAKRPTT